MKARVFLLLEIGGGGIIVVVYGLMAGLSGGLFGSGLLGSVVSVFIVDPELLSLLWGGSFGGVLLFLLGLAVGGGVDAIWE